MTMPGPTVVAPTAADKAFIWGVFPLAGALLGWLVTRLARWLDGLAWAPLKGPARLITSIDEPGRTIGALAVGSVLGAVVAVLAHREQLEVTVGADGATLRRGDGDTSRFSRTDIDAVFIDGKSLVLQGPDGLELSRDTSDLGSDRLRAAFTAHGYRWLADGDPHHDDFRLWVPNMTGLPPAANPLLEARAKARRGHEDADAARIRRELLRLGVVVRDDGKHQYWRVQ